MPLDRVRELVEVAVVERAPDRLPQLVLGHRVEPGPGDERGVVAVDDLADEPRVRVLGAHAGQDGAPERVRHLVGRVQPPPVRTAVEPVPQHRADVLGDGGLVVVQGDEEVVTLEGRGTVAVPAEPAASVDVALLGAPEDLEVAADVVEHAVEQHPDAASPAGLEEPVEVGVVAEARVDAEEVGRVVAVGARREHRAQREPGAAELEQVVEPVLQPREPVDGGRAGRQRLALGTDEAQGVDLPPDGVIGPRRTHGSAACRSVGRSRARGAPDVAGAGR